MRSMHGARLSLAGKGHLILGGSRKKRWEIQRLLWGGGTMHGSLASSAVGFFTEWGHWWPRTLEDSGEKSQLPQ